MTRPAILIPVLLLAGCSLLEPDPETWGMPEDQRGRAENAKFATLVDAYLGWHYATHPVRATFDGIHDRDDRLDDVSAAGIRARVDGQRAWQARVRAIDPGLLADDAYFDWLVLESAIGASLLDLEEVRSWERNPSYYRSIIAGGLYATASLGFAPPDRRMALASERLAAVPAVLEAAKANLKNPAAIHAEMAVEEFAGVRGFYNDSLPQAFAEVKDGDARRRFDQRRREGVAALESFIEWLKKDLAPRSKGPYALGAELFHRKLQLDEMETRPLDQLEAQGESLLRTTQQKLVEVAKRIDAAKPPLVILRETAADHPDAERLLEETRAMLEGLKRQAREKLCDVPPDADCRVQETPAFRRSTSFASMEIPGPFERVAREAYYSITLPEASWDAARREQHLRFYNRHALKLISVHEAYPGHYTQFLAVQNLASKVRRVFGSDSYAEGWAHYCEQAYVDEIAPEDPTLRLHQLHMALLRICRYLVAIRMHARGMTWEEAADFFEKEGYQERANAVREARRGTVDPGYLVYTLGKMQVLDLREECRGAWGSSFDLRTFHNRLLATGYPPLRISRMILLGRRD